MFFHKTLPPTYILSNMTVAGVYTWSYAGGDFEISLRPGPASVFFCEKFMQSASYTSGGIDGGEAGDCKLAVDWKKFGKYQFRKTLASPLTFEGSVEGNEANWRKMEFKRSFSPLELALFGDNGLGTVWNFAYEGGEFEVQFMTDGYNHFNCPKFPGKICYEFFANFKTISIL